MSKNEQTQTIPATRQATILEIIKREKTVSVAELSGRLHINEATIRRDLNKLDRSGLVARTYGGAVLAEGLDSEIPLRIREGVNSEAKNAMARLAAEQIDDGDSIFLDSSSSAEFLVPHIKSKKNLRIVTNGARLAVVLSSHYDATVYCTGGKVREHSLSYAGQLALDALANYHFGKAFFSCRGVCLKNGLTDINEDEAALRKMVLEKSSASYLLADSSKIGNVSFCAIAPIDTIDVIITDRALGKAWSQGEKRGDFKVIC
ncbi:MAG: DeoR/GlpR family DNA-binding transcription regulator [Planctomycetota bacterium]|jgi:DeoR/GlpR family transcriptional regulator of sugar metabolism